MNTKILLSLVACCILAACSKDKYTTRPQLKYKSVNTKTLNRNQTLNFTLEVTDAEGDLQDSIWVQKTAKTCAGGRDFIAKYKMPDFNAVKDFKGEINVCFAYGLNLGCPIIQPSCTNRNDSATFKFWIHDKAKNTSDTITSEEVVIVQ